MDAPPFQTIVIDNDSTPSARNIATPFVPALDLRYIHEPSACLASLRNRLVQATPTPFLAFVDDDEEISSTWLATHHRILTTHNAALSGGPISYIFDPRTPPGIRSCQIFSRTPLEEGQDLPWYWAFTGNCYLRRDALPHPHTPFREHFGKTGGEDTDCFYRMNQAGHRFVAAGPGALVTEHRDYQRGRYRWVLQRAIRNGGNLADMMWSHHPPAERRRLAYDALRKAFRQAREARALSRIDSTRFVNTSIEAGMNFGRFLCVLGYRYREYGHRS